MPGTAPGSAVFAAAAESPARAARRRYGPSVAFLFMLGVVLLGLAAGRFAGLKGWLVVPLLVAVVCLASVVSLGYVDPFLALFSIVWGVLAALGVGIGLLLRRRARLVGA